MPFQNRTKLAFIVYLETLPAVLRVPLFVLRALCGLGLFVWLAVATLLSCVVAGIGIGLAAAASWVFLCKMERLDLAWKSGETSEMRQVLLPVVVCGLCSFAIFHWFFHSLELLQPNLAFVALLAGAAVSLAKLRNVRVKTVQESIARELERVQADKEKGTVKGAFKRFVPSLKNLKVGTVSSNGGKSTDLSVGDVMGALKGLKTVKTVLEDKDPATRQLFYGTGAPDGHNDALLQAIDLVGMRAVCGALLGAIWHLGAVQLFWRMGLYVPQRLVPILQYVRTYVQHGLCAAYCASGGGVGGGDDVGGGAGDDVTGGSGVVLGEMSLESCFPTWTAAPAAVDWPIFMGLVVAVVGTGVCSVVAAMADRFKKAQDAKKEAVRARTHKTK